MLTRLDTPGVLDSGMKRSNTHSATGAEICAGSLGNPQFRAAYGVRYAYAAGSMYRGISSVSMVTRMAHAGMLCFFGSGGLKPFEIEAAISRIQAELTPGMPYGVNLLRDEAHPDREEIIVDLLLRMGVGRVEASAFMYPTYPLVKFRAAGIHRNATGKIIVPNRVMAKLSRPEVAQAFLQPPPENLIRALLEKRFITQEQAQLLAQVPMADDICVESDSGGHTDGGVAFTLFPTIVRMRDDAMARYRYLNPVLVGAAGGIGTPEAAAAAFLLGADFILTGSINQCTVEAGTSDAVKDMLQAANVQDTTYAPAGDLFEVGAKVQVLSRGLLFPARANRLYDLYCHFDSLDQIDESKRREIEERYFKKSFDDVFEEIRSYYSPDFIERVEQNRKHKMAMIFRWYMRLTTQLAIQGVPGRQVDYQIHCGPAMGAFNRWVKGSALEDWKSRHVDQIGVMLMERAASYLSDRIRQMTAGNDWRENELRNASLC